MAHDGPRELRRGNIEIDDLADDVLAPAGRLDDDEARDVRERTGSVGGSEVIEVPMNSVATTGDLGSSKSGLRSLA